MRLAMRYQTCWIGERKPQHERSAVRMPAEHDEAQGEQSADDHDDAHRNEQPRGAHGDAGDPRRAPSQSPETR